MPCNLKFVLKYTHIILNKIISGEVEEEDLLRRAIALSLED